MPNLASLAFIITKISAFKQTENLSILLFAAFQSSKGIKNACSSSRNHYKPQRDTLNQTPTLHTVAGRGVVV